MPRYKYKGVPSLMASSESSYSNYQNEYGPAYMTSSDSFDGSLLRREQDDYISEEEWLEEYETEPWTYGSSEVDDIIASRRKPRVYPNYIESAIDNLDPTKPDYDYLVSRIINEAKYQNKRVRDEALRDPETNRRYLYNDKGSPDDPDYFNHPYNRQTSRVVPNNFMTDALINRVGYVPDSMRLEDPALNVNMDELRPNRSHREPMVTGNADYRSDWDKFLDNPNVVNSGVEYSAERVPYVTMAGKNPGQFKQYSNVISYSNREYICDIVGITGSAITSPWPNNVTGQYKIVGNAGLSVSFPSLSQIVSCFQFYRFKKVCFEYIPVSAESMSNTTLTLGQVMCGINYNVGLPDFVNRYQLINQQDSQVTKPSSRMKFEVDCSRFLDWYYTRIDVNTTTGSYNANTPQSSVQLVDSFNFYICALSVQAATTVGQLWVSYEVDMRSSILQSSLLGSTILYWRSVGNLYSDESYNPPNVLYVEYSSHGSLGCQYIDTSASQAYTGKIQFPSVISVGLYRITVILGILPAGGAGLTNIAFNVLLGNCAIVPALNIGYDGLGTYDISSVNCMGINYTNLSPSYTVGPYYTTYTFALAGQLSNVFVTYINVTGYAPFVGFTLTNAGSISSITSGSITVEQCNPDLVNSMNTYGYIVNN